MSNPEYLFIKPFAWDGLKNNIQESQQVGQDPEDATINKGFPLITMTPKEAGGKAPKGQDMNGILYAISADASHRQKGLRIQFDAAYATKIGGYSAGAIIASNDYTKDYRSLIDGNTTDPNSSNIAGKWEVYSGVGSVPLATSTTTGTVKLVNNLTSTAVDAALAAAQGTALKDIFDKFVFSSASNGYIEIPFGTKTFMLQWGVAKEYTTNSFPKAFPNACLNISATLKNDGGIADSSVTTAHIVSRSQFRVYCGTSTNNDIFWFAIGY